MVEKGGETGGASAGGGGKGEIQNSGTGISARLRADRTYASPTRRRSPGRRSSRRPRPASSPRRRRRRSPTSPPRICSSPMGRSPSPPLSHPICASPPGLSLSQGCCGTAPQRRDSSPRLLSPPRSTASGTRLQMPNSRQRIYASPPGRSPSKQLNHRICASPPRRSLTPGYFSTAPQRRLSSPRRLSPPRPASLRPSGSGGTLEKRSCHEKEYAGVRSSEIPASSRKRSGEPHLDRLVTRSNTTVPRRLDFDGKACDMLKEHVASVNENKSIPDPERKNMNSSLQGSKSTITSGNKRACAINQFTDSIWNTAHGCSERVLATLNFDLSSETFQKKRISSTPSNLINSKGNLTESARTTEQQEQRQSRTVVGCPITGLNHKLFLCPCEQSKSKRLGRAVVENKVIPGGADETNVLVRKSRDELNGMINAVIVSHTRDMSYNGRLSLDNFRVTEDGDVKLVGLEPLPFSNAGGKLDNAKVADIIEHDLFAGMAIPTSIVELLKLLRTGEHRDEHAMSKNISLMTEKDRMSTFQWMLKTLEFLEQSDPTRYKAIMDILEAHSCWHEWQTKATNNDHLSKILNHIEKGAVKPMLYPLTVKGLMRFVRNSIEHLPKHCYDRTTKAALYYLHEIDHIVSGTYAGLFEVLQSALATTG